MFKFINRTDVLIAAGITVAVLLFFLLTGTLFSGYHFTDDHEIIRINEELKSAPFLDVLKKWVINDFAIRFRPFYFVHRVTLIKIFGVHFWMWSVYFMLMLSVTFYLFYRSLQKLNFPVLTSLLFPIIALIGTQTENWWRLGTAENTGALFLSMSFYYLKASEKKKRTDNILFCVSLIMAGICKESFIIIIPAMLFLKFSLAFQLEGMTIRKAVFQNIYLIVPLLFGALFLYIIYSHTGTNAIGYAGINSGDLFSDMIISIKTILKDELRYYVIIMATAIAFALFSVKNDEALILFLKKLGVNLLFIILFLAPLLVLYAKSGMQNNYIIPASVGIAWFFITLFKETGSKISWQTSCLFIICAWAMYMQSGKAITNAQKFAKDKRNIHGLIQSIVSKAKSGNYILLAFDPIASNEAAFSLKTYLETIHKIPLHAVFIDRKTVFSSENLSNSLLSNAQLWFKGKMYDPLRDKDPDILVFLNKSLRIYFFDEYPLNIEHYKNNLTPESPYGIYYK